MAQIIVDLRTTINRMEISHIEVIFLNQTDVTRSQYYIIPRVRFPDGDLRVGIRLVRAVGFLDDHTIRVIVRLLNFGRILRSRVILTNTGETTCTGFWIWRVCEEPVQGITVNIS